MSVHIDTRGLNSKIGRLQQASGKTRDEVVHESARRMTRSLMDWTPPKGGRGTVGRKGLEQRITGDLAGKKERPHGIFIGVNPAPPARRRRERVPDLERAIAKFPMISGGRAWRRRKASPKLYVFRAKLTKALAARKKKTGRQMAGWLAAAQYLGVALPAWIKRHGAGEGSCVLDRKGGLVTISLINAVPYNQKVLSRLAGFAVKRTAGGLETYIKKTIKANIKKSAK